ncbi:MAG TPA: polysaccharide biosynthesis C-terminal domain-containing protein [Mycobacteriales bacterium]|nr:polysaccharide biosynthesis C-terminal domain-containing protein [Mycobacteriales bacterium]
MSGSEREPAAEEPLASSGAAVPARSGRTSLSTILRGGAWQTAGQFIPIAVNLALTPYIIHGLGVDRYGLYMYIASLGAFIGSFDGGLNISTQRFFSIFAGRDDRVETTRLLTTLIGLVGAIGVAITVVLWFLAPPLTELLNMPHQLHSEAIFMVRTMGAIVGTALIRNIPVAVLIARQRYLLINANTVGNHGVYVIGLILTVQNHWGLQGVALTLIAQQVVSTVVLLPQTMKGLSRKGISLYSRKELREFLSYSGKVQITGIAALILTELDGLLLGAVLPIRYVAIYSAGASFATQLRRVPSNAVSPMLTTLGHRFGREGEAGLMDEFRRLQKVWVVGIVGWCAVGTGATLFALDAWLGSTFRNSGIVGAVAMIGSLAYMLPAVMNAALSVAGRPGLEARFSVVMVVVNVGLTIPLVFTGPIGVAAATAAGQIAASIYLMRIVRRRWRPDAPSFFSDVPVVPALVSLVVVLGAELALHPVVPEGPAGLLLCAVPAAIGLALYARLVLGAKPAEAVRRALGREKSAPPQAYSAEAESSVD